MTRTVPFGMVADFSSVASRYDETRDIPTQVLSSCYDHLVMSGNFPKTGTILDAGCGTGQISIPLAAKGYRVVGVDISSEMIKIARSKLRPEWIASFTVGDVRCLGEDGGIYDAVVVSKLFQHIQDWREACRQLIRVTHPGKCIVQINERGAFGNSVRRKFSQLADELGFTDRFVGLNPHSSSELIAFMASEGCKVLFADVSHLRWETAISFEDALGRIRDGLFAEFWHLPVDTFNRLLSDTAKWIDAQPGGAKTIERLTPYLAVEVFQTPTVPPPERMTP